MSTDTQLLFYKNVSAVSSERHRDLCIEPLNFEFAAKVNSVPITAAEIPLVAREYTIVFSGDDELVVPSVLLGIEANKNQYLDSEYAWTAEYIPAFVRRYPFVFSQKDDQFTLCIDESWKGCNREGRGNRIFDEEGNQTPYLKALLNFLGDYQKQHAITRRFSRSLKELNLLDSTQAKLSLPNGENRSLAGFQILSRDKLKDLPPEKLSNLVKSNALELSFLQLSSLKNLAYSANRMVKQTALEVEPTEPVDT